MNWLYLFIAALFEIGWPLGFKYSSLQPHRFWLWMGVSVISMMLSGLFLYLAQRTIPISTAYIIWTGMGAVVTLILGIMLFNDDASPMRLFFALLIIIGVIGLESRS